MASSQSKVALSAVEQKKQELLRRVQEKKAGRQPVSSSSVPSQRNTDSPAPSSGILFNNDGNFLARFQAMQNQTSAQPQGQSTNSPSLASEANSKEPKMTVTMKVVKKAVPTTKVKPSRLDVFDVPDGDNDETGNVVTCNFVNSFGFIVN